MISRELRVTGSVTVFQSDWFREFRLPEIDEIENEELGFVEWTPKGVDDREGALRIMRKAMIQYRRYAGALFIGGMEGVSTEYNMVKELVPRHHVYQSRGLVVRLRVSPRKTAKRLVWLHSSARGHIRTWHFSLLRRWQDSHTPRIEAETQRTAAQFNGIYACCSICAFSAARSFFMWE